MRRNNDDFVQEIFQRSEKLIAKRNRRIKVATGCVSMGLCVALLFLLEIPGIDTRPPIQEQESTGEEDFTNENFIAEGNTESDAATDEEIGTTYPEQSGDETEDSDRVEDESAGNGEDCVDGIPETEEMQVFRGMEILSIEGDTIILLDGEDNEVIYLITEDGIYDVVAEELLELSEEELIFWKEILSTLEED